MKILILLILIAVLPLTSYVHGVDGAVNPYEVLGIDRNASQRDIQKAFHKLSLKYHPDKNKEKGAQEKFAKINNAYEILSDEEKRKNYDLHGNEDDASGFERNGHSSRNKGYTFFSGGEGNHRFTFRPSSQWQGMDMDGNSESFSFSFGSDPTAGPFSFGGFGDIFSSIFGGNTRNDHKFGGTGDFGGDQSLSSPLAGLQAINSKFFKKRILDQGSTWMILFYTSLGREYKNIASTVENTAISLQGVIKAGQVDCRADSLFCKELGIMPSRSPHLFAYSYGSNGVASFVEYQGHWDIKSLKIFCQEKLPRFSRRIDVGSLETISRINPDLPKVALLSTKKDTPVIWRALSGLYRKDLVFYDLQIDDISKTAVKGFGVEVLPAVVGLFSTGETHVLRTGPIKDLKSGMEELQSLLETFMKKNKLVSDNKKDSQSQAGSGYEIPELTSANMHVVCNEKASVCIIGVYRSSKARKELEAILSSVSHKTLTRRTNHPYGSKGAMTYSLLNASKQQSFLNGFEKSGFKSSQKLLLAYKPKKTKFAVLKEPSSVEEVERYASSILSGDIQFTRTLKNPVLI